MTARAMAYAEFQAALAEDAETLARLHDRELDAAALHALRTIGFPDSLGMLPADAAARAAWSAMRTAMAGVPPRLTLAQLDILAADYAAIYLTGACNASPCESFWLDEDHLHCQEPMWQLREIYAAAGLAAADWRKRPDDHLVLQLHYVAHALRRADSGAELAALAAMLDAHLLRWLPDFAARVAARAEQPFYAALAGLTLAWCLTLRTWLATAR